MIEFALETLELVILIINTSYILGMLWFIMCDSFEDFILSEMHEDESVYKDTEDYFLYAYKFSEYSTKEKIVAVTYYAFTSLSTVGFGDFHPKSDFERMMCAFILLFGVAIFSYIMGIFIEILNSIKRFYDEPNEDRNL